MIKQPSRSQQTVRKDNRKSKVRKIFLEFVVRFFKRIFKL